MTSAPVAPRGFRGVFRTDDFARALYAEGAGIFRMVPAAVAAPADVADLVTLVHWAREHGTALVPRGAGSGMPGGNVGPGVIVDLTHGFRGLDVDPAGRRARTGAAVTWRALDEAAAAHGLRLPPDPSSGAFCTLGGMAATNAAGARTVKYGAMREWVEAVEFVTADGEIGLAGRQAPDEDAGTAAERRLAAEVVPWLRRHRQTLAHATPHTRKNSSGLLLANYPDDGWVRHLLIGSEGTLAFITGVTVRLAPRPARLSTLLVTLRSLNDVAPAVLALTPLGPSAIELLDRTYLEFVRATGSAVPAGSEAVLLVEVEGEPGPAQEAVRPIAATTQTATDAEAVAKLWELRHLASPILARLPGHQRSLQLVEDGCVPLERLGEYITGLREIALECGFPIVIFGHAGDAHVHANILADAAAPDLPVRLETCLRETSALQIALGGTTSGEHGDGRLRAPFLEAVFGDAYVDACRRVKRAFDPAGILNPGVKLPGAPAKPLLDPGVLKVGAAAPPLPEGVAEALRDIERGARWTADRFELADTLRGARM